MNETPAARRALLGVSPRAYEHPADRSALAALRKLEGYGLLLRALSGLLRDRAHRYYAIANGVRVGERQFADVHRLVVEGAGILDLAEVPEVFVVQSPLVLARTTGLDHPFVVLSTATLDLFDEDELRFVVGHELGHVLSGHGVYRTMLDHVLTWSLRIAWVPLGTLGLRALLAALTEWYRRSELSGDRAGLLAGQDPDVALRALMKLAGGSRLHEMDQEAFLAQAEEYEASGDVRDSVIKLLNLETATHPFPVARARALREWIDDGSYARVLSGDYPRRADDPQVSVLDEAKEAARTYRDAAQRSADPLVRLLRQAGGEAASAGERIYRKMSGQE